MGKLVNWFIALIGAVVLLAIAGVVLLTTFLNPNQFKPMIQEQVKKQTGRDLIMDGDLAWSFFPYLGLKTGHIALANPAGFTSGTFAEMSGATVGVKILPLLRKKIESSGVLLSGVKLNLIKSANGATNWVLVPPTAAQTTAAETTGVTATSQSKAVDFDFSISSIDVEHANIHWQDDVTKQSGDIQEFELHAKDVAFNHTFPLAIGFEFSAKKPQTVGKLNFSTEVTLNPEKKLYTFKEMAITTAVNQENKKFTIRLTGNVEADLQQQIARCMDLNGQMANVKFTGNVTANHLLSAPQVAGRVNLQPFDLRELMQDLGQDVSAIQVAKNASGDFDFSASQKSMNVQGKTQLDDLQLTKIKLHRIHMTMNYENALLTVNPLTAELYEGNLQSNANVRLTGEVPQIAVNAKLLNVHAEPLMKDLAMGNKLKVTGIGNVNVQVTTQGTSADTILKNLNGTSQFNFNNGAVQGMDIGYYVETAYKLATHQDIRHEDAGQTTFGNLTGTAVIRNGVVTNNDLLLSSPRFDTKGQGTIDLVNQRIDYRLESAIKSTSNDPNNSARDLAGIPITLTIIGSLQDPAINVDKTAIIKAIAEKEMQKNKQKVIEKAQDKIKNIIKDKLPEDIQKQVSDKAGEMLKGFLNK
ncbi:hypothetical protein AYO45_03060 [Gammaproteobacteria bacterium SCGC AG-212-F23]|nr:hypothetical protein AYO45_03060 [Gammaproteobacteria bacterium SCGC AG-212-F23]